ncbi:fimbrial protein [Escherichia coli]|jgi:minor fimbrial subunit|nr:fimbrial protein [Escherichia coli]MED9311391.1 fimbrial protein [Escherichia coli]
MMNIIWKRKFIIFAIASSFMGASSVNAVDININGLVLASPCVVNGGNSAVNVNIGDNIQADSLSAAGSTSSWKDFTLQLTNCPLSTSSFSVAFSGTPDGDIATNYANTGSATNLSLELTTQDGSTTLGNGSSINNTPIPGSHAYDLQLRTRAVSKGDVMPGSITGLVQATFTYQ